MTIETATFLNDLNASNPANLDQKLEGDDHMRLIKAVLKATFPDLAGRFMRWQGKSVTFNHAVTDNMSVFSCSGTFTINLAAAASCGNGHMFLINQVSGTATIDPAGSELVNGASTFNVPANVLAIVLTDGVGWICRMLVGSVSGSGSAVLDTNATITTPTINNPTLTNCASTIFIPAKAITARTTAGAAQNSIELASNKVMVDTLDFDPTTQEHGQFTVAMPASWNEGTLSVSFLWSHPATATNFGVVWGIQATARSDTEALDVAFGSVASVADTGGSTDVLYRSPSVSLTVGSVPANNDTVIFQVLRDVANVSDTMAVDARLHGIVMTYAITNLLD